MPRPNLAPAGEWVAMPEGSSSEAPVISPGPKDLEATIRDLARSDQKMFFLLPDGMIGRRCGFLFLLLATRFQLNWSKI